MRLVPAWLRKAIAAVVGPTGGQVAPVSSGSFWGYVREPFAGAWQKNIQVEAPQNLLAFSAVYACVTLICDDISKLRLKLMEQERDATWSEVTRASPFLGVVTKPNRYQTRIQFIQQWLASKLLHGNAYIVKERDQRGVVINLYALNPFAVTPLIASDGSVFYRINRELLAGIDASITVPGKEIIHDRCTALWHPLVGVSPIYACGATATQGARIQANSEKFYQNMSRPSGMITAPGTINDDTAARIKREFETNFGAGNVGRLLVAGDALKYEPLSMSAADSQLIEQLRWTVEDVARAFKVPMYKLGGQLPPGSTVAQLNQDYYSQTLQALIEAIELLLTEGLELPNANKDAKSPTYGIELDLEGLLRMDPQARAETYKNMIGSGVMAPNEARARENLPPVAGGETPYMQQQNYSLGALARRDAATPAPATPPLGDTPPPEPSAAPPPKAGRVIEGEFVEVEEKFLALLRGAIPEEV